MKYVRGRVEMACAGACIHVMYGDPALPEAGGCFNKSLGSLYLKHIPNAA